MKIALQLSGRFRYTDSSLASLIGAILEPLQPDVYCSFWYPENSSAIDRYFLNVKPVAWEFEQQHVIKPYLDFLFQYNIHANMPSMSYKFYRASQVRQIHNKSYDIVIQARTDNIFFEKLDVDRCRLALDKQAILCANQGYNPIIDDHIPQPRMVDNFYLGPTNLVDQANMTFWYLKNQAELYTKANQLHHVRIPEIIQTNIWQKFGIKIDGLPGTGSVGNFWYDIDRTDTLWR